MSTFLEARTRGMSPAQKQAYLKFNRLCDRASKCRSKLDVVSCWACNQYENCSIQKEINKQKKIYQ